MTFRASLLCALALAACNTSPKPEEGAPPPPVSTAAPSVARQSFGAPLGKSPSAAISDVLKTPDKFADQTVLVEGDVRRACTRKGCWMELSSGPDAPGCRVTFKDYAFFVPTSSAGSKALIEAKVETKLVGAAMVQHLEEEGAQFADKAADGSAREVRLVATGVELWR